MYNTIPPNGWPQIKALQNIDSLSASKEVTPTDQTANKAAKEDPEELVKDGE